MKASISLCAAPSFSPSSFRYFDTSQINVSVQSHTSITVSQDVAYWRNLRVYTDDVSTDFLLQMHSFYTLLNHTVILHSVANNAIYMRNSYALCLWQKPMLSKRLPLCIQWRLLSCWFRSRYFVAQTFEPRGHDMWIRDASITCAPSMRCVCYI